MNAIFRIVGSIQHALVARDQPEVASLLMYFDALFEEVARGEGLQVLVLGTRTSRTTPVPSGDARAPDRGSG